MQTDRIMPFLWLKRETKDELEKELYAMLDMGITSFVVESRVHEAFCKDAWFEEMDYIMEFAHSHNMRVWLLDDKSYPTGYANGSIFSEGKKALGRRVKASRTDISGKKSDIKVRIDIHKEYDEELLAVFLARRSADYWHLTDIVDVTQQVFEDTVYLDVGEGYYSVISVVETSNYYERQGYIDMLNPASVHRLIETVYEPHYERYKNYFGNTFCGFFSDEPRFNCFPFLGNFVANAYDGKIGRYGMAYPWSKSIQAKMGVDSEMLGLWFDIGEKTSNVRCKYMELITDAYAENFVGQLSQWCRERGVLYTGHIIEDMGAHTSVMCSSGHYFKSMKDADIASVDVVINQIQSLENDGFHMAQLASGYSDSTFFNYTLMKLASSCAHVQKNKNGRALCEIFGAYGWGESMSEMLYLANHALVRGVNYFIPHAFTSEFDNKDCPPHFYAGGLNPSNNSYRLLFDYMRTMADIFSDGKPLIDVAVLYHAQAEWSGGAFEPCDVIAKELMQNQIDFDFVDFEALADGTIQDGELVIGDNTYKLLLVPYFEGLPKQYQNVLDRFASNIIYSEKEGKGIAECVKAQLGYTYPSVEHLRILRYEKEQKHYVMLFNEGNQTCYISPQEYCTGFTCGTYANDYITGTYYPVAGEQIPVKPLQALVCEDEKRGICASIYQTEYVFPEADIFLKKYDETNFVFYKHVEKPFFNINRYDEAPDFSGFVKIVPCMDWENVRFVKMEYDAEFCDLHIGDKVYQSIGGQLFLDMTDINCKGEEVYVVLGSGLGNALKDSFSQCHYISPCKMISIAMEEV